VGGPEIGWPLRALTVPNSIIVAVLCADFVCFVIFVLKIVYCLSNPRAYEYHHKGTKSTKDAQRLTLGPKPSRIFAIKCG